MAWKRFRVSVHCIATYALWCLQWAPAAHGDPISATILTYLTGATWGFTAGATGVLLQLAGNAILAALPGLLLNAVIGVGLTMLANALRPQPQAQAVADPGARIVNLRQSVQDRTKAYGMVRLGGAVAFWKAKGGKRYVAVLLNTGEIASIEAYYLDETEVTLDGAGYVTQTKFISQGSPMIRIGGFLGAPGQVAHPFLTGAFSEWTADHKLTGIAGLVGVFQNPRPEDFPTIYPGGREQTMSALFKATKVYDPRDGTQTLGVRSTYKWTTNAALIIADWCVDRDGLGAEVDWDDVALEADASDVTVLDRSGNPVPRWQLCGSYSLAQSRESVRQAMAIACDAFFFDRDDGKVGFHVGRWMEPAVTITDVHLNTFRMGEGQDGTDQANAMSVQYIDPATGYRQFQSAPYVLDDGKPYEEDTFQAYWIPNHNQGVRVAKRVLLARRAPLEFSANLKLYGLVLRDQRFFRLELAELGISGNFELATWSFADNGMSINITAKSVSAAYFDFNAAIEEPVPGEIGDITVDDSIADPTGVTLSSPASGALHVTFNPAPRPSLLKRVRFRKVGAPDWNESGVPASQDYLTINGLPPGDVYEAQVQFRTAAGSASNWVASTPASVVVSATSSPPLPVTDVAVTPGAGTATFDWTAQNSPNYVGARIYVNATNVFPGGTPAAVEYGLPNAPDSKVISLSPGLQYGWVAAINSAGDQAAPVATGSFTVT